MLLLTTKIAKVPLIGPAFESRLEKLGIKTVKDLLWHIPFRYDDFSLLVKANSLQEGEVVTVQGKVLEIKNFITRTGFAIENAKIEDDSGIVQAVWFNQRFLTSAIHKGDMLNLSGKVKKGKLENPQYEVLFGTAIHTGRLVPIYPETQGISSKWLRSRINFVLKNLEITDYFSFDQISQIGQISLIQAVNQIHFPDNLDQAAKARDRLAFDELLFSGLESRARKADWQKKTVGQEFKPIELTTFLNTLPFTLTPAQKRVADEILADLKKFTPMNRLLQGDVGSGKTVIAALAMLAAHKNGYQSVLMAPTEILAKQHHETLTKLLDIPIGIATGSKKDYSNYDIVVGTHALITERVNFKKLGLVVIDEQHRFGVGQRAKLTAKGNSPHVLTMTATPIPRTVALTLYGDLDVSILDEMPKNRLQIKTWVVPGEKRAAAYNWIKKQQTQTFVVCPLIEQSESETLAEVKAVKKEYENLKKIFPDQKLGLLHGRLKAAEKDLTLKKFRDQKIDMLVATPVIEVGIDIPSATIMVIEAADRFGLAQLHQLRGRVGRGNEQSYCLLFTQNKNGVARLKYLEKLTDGLKLAEADLKFRGPGQRFGTAQHGRWDLKIADFTNLELVERSSKLAAEILRNPSGFPALLKLIRESKINVVPN